MISDVVALFGHPLRRSSYKLAQCLNLAAYFFTLVNEDPTLPNTFISLKVSVGT